MEFICVNKNRKVFNTSKGAVVIDIVNVPKYRIGDNEFTEYDMRHLQLQVAQGLIDHEAATELGIVDSLGVKFEFRPDGCLINNVQGYDQTSRYTLDLLKEKRKERI
jgi:hypothetical protein